MRLATPSQPADPPLQVLPTPDKSHVPFRTSAHEKIDCPSSDRTAESTQYLALAARATNDALRDWDVGSGRVHWPHGLESLLGYKASAAAAEIGFWQKHVHPDDRARAALGIREALDHAEHWSGEYRFRHADGRYLHLLERATIVRDEEGQAQRFVGSLMDITARKQLQDQLCRSQKMEAFGQLASGVAHDFNNFLTTILGYSDLLLGECATKGHIASHLREIRSAAGRASTLTAQLLAFSRKQPLEPRVLEVNSLITNLERALLRLVGENITVECDLHHAKDGAHVRVDPGQMTQIILNLVVNGRDAISRTGRIIVATGSLRINETPSEHCSDDLAPGDYVSISVTDNGKGMTDEVKAHLFEPFFTTKHDGTGSGLGLATSYGIVRQSGGQICVDSELGRGTTVTIYLPRVAAPAPSPHKKGGSRKLPTGTETILLLEDDVAVRHLAVRILRSLGYTVLEAARADDAQRIVEGDDAIKLHLLITDIVMPHTNGRDFADWLRSTKPNTKVVFISGYLDESLQLDGSKTGMFFLPKPFDAEQLAAKVREALDARP
jgi:two-component system, cell cycle sensor histidine kinase and response regulator CckA